jgi:nucleoporin NDC1
MESRIIDYQRPPPTVADAKAKALGVNDPALPPDPTALPRIAEPLKDRLKAPGDIFTATPAGKTESQRAVEAVGRFAKRHGQSPPESLSPKSKQLLLKAESAVLTKQQQEALSKEGITGLFRNSFLVILKTSFGWPWRQEYRRKMAAVILGTPYGDVGIIVDAIDALTRFAVCSLAEDKYGNVQRDVKTIIRTFTKAINTLEEFKQKLGFHWTDVEPKQESPEADTILAALKGGLSELITHFGSYAQDLGLSLSEMRKAREAATAPAMAEVR